MLVHNEPRFQYTYFILSTLVASALLLLTYLSLRTSANYRLRDDLKLEQKSFVLMKPLKQWNYNNTWKIIGNAALRHQIYSAYFDFRTDLVDDVDHTESETLIGSFRILAILPTKLNNEINCILRYDDFSIREVAAKEVKALEDHNDLTYSAFQVMCPLRVKKHVTTIKLPQLVALSYASNRLSQLSQTFIPISYPRNMTAMFYKPPPILSVCVAPLQRNNTDPLRIVEFIEFYRILGAKHFYFYILSASSDVRRLLEHYRKMGIAEVLTWNVELHLHDLHQVGIVAQINDCIYRAMVVDNYRYAVPVDLDEILMPLKHNSLMTYLLQCDEGRTSAYNFRNVFFYRRDANDTFSTPKHSRNRHLYTQTKVRRGVETMPVYTLSKSVVNPRGVVEMGIHRVCRNAPGYTDFTVGTSVGLLFHYREKCYNCKAYLIIDYTARRFGSLIWDQVDEVCLKVFLEKRGICPAA